MDGLHKGDVMADKRRNILLVLVALALLLCGWLSTREDTRSFLADLIGKAKRKTVADRLAQYGPPANARLLPFFAKAGVSYPPAQLSLVGIKKEKVLEVYAAGADSPLKFIRRYPIVCASGRLGPKLQAGDLQVPEGIYTIESLNPNSLYHLALRVGYPNDFDRRMADDDGRKDLGGDIMIHGSNGSVGCLAMGDEASEDLFVLAAQIGIEKIRVILSPVDFRKEYTTTLPATPQWVAGLYSHLRDELRLLSPP